VIRERASALGFALSIALAACGPAPVPRTEVTAPSVLAAPRPEPDPCSAKPGGPAPTPLRRPYSGLARAARCEAELASIMKRTSEALGVRCTYCHLEQDYAAPTERKDIANWMSTELVPALVTKHEKHSISCASCHASLGKPTPRLLGAPRSEASAIEWMTTHMVEDFARADARPLRCKTCHGANLGAQEFRRHLYRSHLDGLSIGTPASNGAPPAVESSPLP
jgi:hypothetical protein